MDVKSAQKSDLGVRTVSAVVMVAVAGLALWAGGGVWALFVGLVAAGVLMEWSRLVMAFSPKLGGQFLWHVGGLVYVGVASFALLMFRGIAPGAVGMVPVLGIIGTVIAVDVWAYFTGRKFGGPKIAPSISPSKTWSGLWGGMAGATVLLFLISHHDWRFALAGPPVAVIAQAGDFFESWMKRRAGVKDSGKLIPGHGGLFDRVDGLLAVCFVLGLALLGSVVFAIFSGASLLPSPA